MESNKFNKVDIKNHTCCYSDDIIKIEDSNFNNILIYEKPYNFMTFHANIYLFQNHFVLNLMKLMDLLEFMMGLDIYHYLVLKNVILFTIDLNILFSQKSSITHVFSHNYAKLCKVNSYDSLPLEKTLTLKNVIIFIKSVFNKDKNHYYYKKVSEKCSYQYNILW